MPDAVSRLWVRSRIGASAWQGTHHEAQKFSTTTLPRRAATDCVASDPSTGSDALGAGGKSPRATACSIESSSAFAMSP